MERPKQFLCYKGIVFVDVHIILWLLVFYNLPLNEIKETCRI